MSAWVSKVHRIITAVSKQIIALQSTICAEVGDIVGADESTDLGVVITRL